MTRRRRASLVLLLGLLASLAFAARAGAQLAVSANDSKVLNVNGVVTVVSDPSPDTVSLIDLKQSPPKVIGEVPAPVSVVGPLTRRCVGPAPRATISESRAAPMRASISRERFW